MEAADQFLGRVRHEGLRRGHVDDVVARLRGAERGQHRPGGVAGVDVTPDVGRAGRRVVRIPLGRGGQPFTGCADER